MYGAELVRKASRAPAEVVGPNHLPGIFWTGMSDWRDEVSSQPVKVNSLMFPVRRDIKCHLHPVPRIKLTISFAL